MRTSTVALGALLLAAFTIPAFAQHGGSATVDPGWTSDFAKAQAKAKREGKLLLVDFNATWCGPCQMYRHDVFPTAEFKKATKDVVLVSIDVDKQPALAGKYGVNGIPDIRLVSPSGKAVGGVVGYGGAQPLLAQIAQARLKAAHA